MLLIKKKVVKDTELVYLRGGMTETDRQEAIERF